MTTLEDLKHPSGPTLIFEYNYSNRKTFLQDLFETLIQSLEEEFNIIGLSKGSMVNISDEEQYYQFQLKGDGMRRTDVYFVPYEEEERIVVEWKFKPIQTGYILKVKDIIK